MSGQSESGVPTKIVVETDGSATAERAVHKAPPLARAVRAELFIVSACNNHGPTGVASTGFTVDAGWGAAAQGAAESVATEAAEKARAQGWPWSSLQAVAGPSEALIRVTEEQHAGLLVVGSKGMQSTARFLLGPIVKKVSRKVDCDLLIVETGE